jgi:glycosyltransferase involved in cell wall biosynthesis
MNSLDVAVVIPSYNAAHTIRRALDSALGQTAPPGIVIVVDDGSTDRTRATVAEYGARVRYLFQANAGPGAARNRGARMAGKPFLALLDADDEWLPNRLAVQLPQMADPKTALVATWLGRASDSSEGSSIDVTFEMLWAANRFVTSSALVRTAALEAVGGFDESRSLISVEDYNLWLRLASAGWRLTGRSEAACRYLPAEGSLSRQSERMAAAEMANLEILRKQLRLSPAVARAKRIAIAEQYARDLLFFRELSAARRMLAMPLIHAPTPRRLLWWMATFAPAALLDFRRRIGPQAPAEQT